MNNTIFLPRLRQVKIANYSLYNQDIEYSFIDGVNLIVGGNGVGKTTFINIIKYALIGLYKKDLVVRNYQGEKRMSRGTYKNGNTYFRNRTKNTSNDRNAYVTLEFEINETIFIVTRSLYETVLLEACTVTNNGTTAIQGEVIRQDAYARYENSKEAEKERFLQYNYEKAVAQASNMGDFTDVIFFVNQILMFGEDRLNVLWDESVQSRLLSNYLNDADLEKKRKDAANEAKYQDSIARHKQEEIKAIRRVLDKVKGESEKESNGARLVELIAEIENLEQLQKEKDHERNEIQRRLQTLYKNVSAVSIQVNSKENEINRVESTLASEYWPGVNAKYYVYKQQFSRNHICPMCNSQIHLKANVDLAENECFLCHTKLGETQNAEIGKLRDELNQIQETRHNYEQEIEGLERDLDILDREVRRLRANIFKLRNEYRTLDTVEAPNVEEETAYTAMITQIQELTDAKDDAQRKSDQLRNYCDGIIKCIEENLTESTRSVSDIFQYFAEAFLRLPCKLTLTSANNSNVKLFVPVIDDRPRFDSEELSESQRFFVDYSFRMSILAYFYSGPSFYICETPDSSLDLSYEENAANTLLKYVEKPNSLILTSNLNNSTFIKSLLKKTDRINVLNLLKYGKVSAVQTNHLALQELSNEIEAMIRE